MLLSSRNSGGGDGEYGDVFLPRQGMERRGAHLYCLPSASRSTASSFASELSSTGKTASGPAASSALSDAGSSVATSAPSSSFSSPRAQFEGLPASQSPQRTNKDLATEEARRSTDMASTNTYSRKEWGLVSIIRILDSPGIVLITLYHVPSHAMFGWPLQTDPRHRSPDRAIVFVTPRGRRESTDRCHHKTSESLCVLSDVLVTWMRHSSSLSPSVKRKLGEREQDTLWLAHTMNLAVVGPSLAKELRKKQEVPTHKDLFPDDDTTEQAPVARVQSTSSKAPQSILIGSDTSCVPTPPHTHDETPSPASKSRPTSLRSDTSKPSSPRPSSEARSVHASRSSFEQTQEVSEPNLKLKGSGPLRKFRSMTSELSTTITKSLSSPFSSSSSSLSSSPTTATTTADVSRERPSRSASSSPAPGHSRENKPKLSALQTTYGPARASTLSTVPSIEVWSPTSPPATSIRPPWTRGVSSTEQPSSASSIESVFDAASSAKVPTDSEPTSSRHD